MKNNAEIIKILNFLKINEIVNYLHVRILNTGVSLPTPLLPVPVLRRKSVKTSAWLRIGPVFVGTVVRMRAVTGWAVVRLRLTVQPVTRNLIIGEHAGPGDLGRILECKYKSMRNRGKKNCHSPSQYPNTGYIEAALNTLCINKRFATKRYVNMICHWYRLITFL